MTHAFIPDPLGIAKLARTEGMQSAMGDKAKEVAELARAIAPVETGLYQASIQASQGVEDGRAVGRVGSDVDYAAYVEFGTSTHEAHGTLRRALEGSDA